MDSDSAIVVYTTGSDEGTTDQPNRILDDNAASANNERPSAIERQRVAIQAGATRNRVDQNTQPSTPGSRLAAFFYGLYHSDSSRFGRQVSLSLLLIAAAVVSMLSIFHAVKKETAPQAELAQITKALKKPPTSSAPSEKDVADSITIPISDISLRAQPQLLQQVVAAYRLRLAADPDNSVAKATLSRIREHSLAELAAISATESAPLATDSLRLAVRLFPELAREPRYQSIAARINTNANNMARSELPVVTEPTVATQQSAPAATPAPTVVTQQPPPTTPTPTIAAQQPKPVATPAPTAVTQQPKPATTPMPVAQPAQPLTPVAPAAQPPTHASNPITQPPVAVVTRKPQVRVMALTSGIIRKDRFIPTKGGNVFRLNIGFRHRDNPLVNQPGAGLVAQLSESSSSEPLGKVPVEIVGSSGEKSFLIETSTKGKIDKFYTLNFVVDGYELPSHRVQLSQP